MIDRDIKICSIHGRQRIFNFVCPHCFRNRIKTYNNDIRERIIIDNYSRTPRPRQFVNSRNVDSDSQGSNSVDLQRQRSNSVDLQRQRSNSVGSHRRRSNSID